MPTFIQCQLLWLSQAIILARDYAGNHIPLGAQAYAGYHRQITFANQSSTPTAVNGYLQAYGTSSALTIQTPGPTPTVQKITPVKYTASAKYNIQYNKSGSIVTNGFTIFRVNVRTAPIIGSRLQTVTVSILLSSLPADYVTQAYNIAYTLPTGTLKFSSLVSAFSTTFPTYVNSGLGTPPNSSPLWAMAQYNSVFSGTPSAGGVGAYLSSCVVYISNKAMNNAAKNKWWTVTVTGVV
jgi:hypothetical protein